MLSSYTTNAKQTQQDSNPHLTVLETVVLPLNYTSKISFYSADTITQQAYDLLHLFLVVNAKNVSG